MKKLSTGAKKRRKALRCRNCAYFKKVDKREEYQNANSYFKWTTIIAKMVCTAPFSLVQDPDGLEKTPNDRCASGEYIKKNLAFKIKKW